MTESLYIASLEPNSGKLVISLGVMEMLSREIDRLGFSVLSLPDRPKTTAISSCLPTVSTSVCK
jgi:hypothetical protein